MNEPTSPPNAGEGASDSNPQLTSQTDEQISSLRQQGRQIAMDAILRTVLEEPSNTTSASHRSSAIRPNPAGSIQSRSVAGRQV